MSAYQGRSGAYALWSGLKSEHERYKDAVTFLPSKKIKLQEDLRRYLCLRCAGFLEQVTHTVLTDHIAQKSSGPVAQFATSHFQRVPNLRVKPFIVLIGRFGDSYKKSFVAFLGQAGRRDILSDLLQVRNDVAHGKQHTGQKLDPERYIKLCDEIYGWLVDTFLGASVAVLADDGQTLIAYENSPGQPAVSDDTDDEDDDTDDDESDQ